jgi:hypothetical protein
MNNGDNMESFGKQREKYQLDSSAWWCGPKKLASKIKHCNNAPDLVPRLEMTAKMSAGMNRTVDAAGRTRERKSKNSK